MLLLLCTKRGRCKAPGLRPVTGSPLRQQVPFAFTTPLGLVSPMTRTHVRLLGPCFKTGRRRRRPTRNRDAGRASEDTRYTSPLSYPPGAELGNRGWPTSDQLLPEPQSTPSGSLRLPPGKCNHRRRKRQRRAIAGPRRRSSPDESLNPRRPLRVRLRLPLHSFTYS